MNNLIADAHDEGAQGRRHLTLQELSQHSGRSPQTLRLHISQKWLPAEKIPGARGWRVKGSDAAAWMGKYLGKDLPPL